MDYAIPLLDLQMDDTCDGINLTQITVNF